MGVCTCVPLFTHPWGTYITDEIRDVSRAAGQCSWWWGARPAERGVTSQRGPSQRGSQGCQLSRVAQLADVVGILQTKCRIELGSMAGWSFHARHLPKTGPTDLGEAGRGSGEAPPFGTWVPTYHLGSPGPFP